MGARTAPGRGWTLAARRRPEEAQSGACAPPQGRPTRPPPISRGPGRPLPTTRTLTRVGVPTGPRRWPGLHTAETTALTTHVVSFRPLILQYMPCRRRPCRAVAWKHQITRWNARTSSLGRASAVLVQEFCASPSGSVRGSAITHLACVSGTAPGSGTAGPPLRHQEPGRSSLFQTQHCRHRRRRSKVPTVSKIGAEMKAHAVAGVGVSGAGGT